jgi:hypothetical protein
VCQTEANIMQFFWTPPPAEWVSFHVKHLYNILLPLLRHDFWYIF